MEERTKEVTGRQLVNLLLCDSQCTLYNIFVACNNIPKYVQCALWIDFYVQLRICVYTGNGKFVSSFFQSESTNRIKG